MNSYYSSEKGNVVHFALKNTCLLYHAITHASIILILLMSQKKKEKWFWNS